MFLTVPTRYASISLIEEGLENYRRTGSTTILAVGPGHIANIGKGIKALANRAVKKVSAYDSKRIMPVKSRW